MSLTVTLRNLSDLAEVSDYHYEASVNGRCIESGYVRKHNRSDGWDGLMLLLGSEREVKERYPHNPSAPSKPTKSKLAQTHGALLSPPAKKATRK